MMTRHSSHSPLTGALPNTITQTSSTSAGAVGLPASEVQAASLNAAIASTEPSSPSTGISPSSSSGSGTVPTSPSDALKLAAAPTGPTREFDFELDHSDQAFYGSDGSAGAPISPHQAAPSDSSFLTQWPFTPTPVGPQVNNDPLVDVLCSFSNVRRRLEIEERDRLMSIFEEGDMDANEDSKSETGSKSKSNNNYEARKSWWNGNLVRDNEVGLGSRDRMDALRNVGTFKGEFLMKRERLRSSHGTSKADHFFHFMGFLFLHQAQSKNKSYLHKESQFPNLLNLQIQAKQKLLSIHLLQSLPYLLARAQIRMRDRIERLSI